MKKEKKVIETFKRITYHLREFEEKEPWCFNREVGVTKTRITIETIEENPEVIHKRIIDLWEHSNNWHDADPLKAAAKKHGLDLSSYERGCKRGKRRK